jgi:hypothetical protein
LKYQRKVSISPTKGNPRWPGGNFVAVPESWNFRGRTYHISFHHHVSKPNNGRDPITQANNTPIVISILKHATDIFLNKYDLTLRPYLYP